MDPKYIPYSELAKKIGSIIDDEITRRKIKNMDLAKMVAENYKEYAATTITQTISNFRQGHPFDMPCWGKQQTRNKPKYLRRLSYLLDALEIAEDHRIIGEIREMYGEEFVYPPVKDKVSQRPEPLDWVI